MEILTQLGINNGFFWMLGLYVGTFIIVYFLGLKDLAVGMVERHNRINGRAEQAQHLKEELHNIREKLNAEMKRVRIESNEVFLSLRTKAANEQKNILAAAREKATHEIKAVRAEVTEKMQQETKKLESEIPALAALIVERISNGGASTQRGTSTELRG